MRPSSSSSRSSATRAVHPHSRSASVVDEHDAELAAVEPLLHEQLVALLEDVQRHHLAGQQHDAEREQTERLFVSAGHATPPRRPRAWSRWPRRGRRRTRRADDHAMQVDEVEIQRIRLGVCVDQRPGDLVGSFQVSPTRPPPRMRPSLPRLRPGRRTWCTRDGGPARRRTRLGTTRAKTPARTVLERRRSGPATRRRPRRRGAARAARAARRPRRTGRRWRSRTSHSGPLSVSSDDQVEAPGARGQQLGHVGDDRSRRARRARLRRRAPRAPPRARGTSARSSARARPP